MEHTCCFFGHKDTPETIKGNLFAAIEQLIVEHGVETFYVGNQGSFDFYTKLESVCRFRILGHGQVLVAERKS